MFTSFCFQVSIQVFLLTNIHIIKALLSSAEKVPGEGKMAMLKDSFFHHPFCKGFWHSCANCTADYR